MYGIHAMPGSRQADGTLRAGLRAENLVTALVGVVLATEIAGGQAQLGRLFDLVLDGARGRPAQAGPEVSEVFSATLRDHLVRKSDLSRACL
jgi:hypothetical protein